MHTCDAIQQYGLQVTVSDVMEVAGNCICCYGSWMLFILYVRERVLWYLYAHGSTSCDGMRYH
jgi:hypothetical protein